MGSALAAFGGHARQICVQILIKAVCIQIEVLRHIVGYPRHQLIRHDNRLLRCHIRDNVSGIVERAEIVVDGIICLLGEGDVFVLPILPLEFDQVPDRKGVVVVAGGLVQLAVKIGLATVYVCLLYTSPSPRD